jgi:hypothetical protein
MTQISLKLFNKTPLARSDIRSLSRTGRCRKATLRGQIVFIEYVYVCGCFR